MPLAQNSDMAIRFPVKCNTASSSLRSTSGTLNTCLLEIFGRYFNFVSAARITRC